MRVNVFHIILAALCLITTNSFAQSSMINKSQLPSLYNGNDDGFIVIAHRGASAYYPENTMSAIKGALAMNAEMIEIDVLLSKDGVPVVFHDKTLNDHTNGTGYVQNHTVEELKKLDAGSWFHKSFSDQKIPTLEEVLAFASGNIAINIEIKTEAVSDKVRGGIEEKSLKLVKKYNMENHVLFSSFDYRAIAHLRALDRKIPTALLYSRRRSERMLPHNLVEQYHATAFNCSYRQLNNKWIADLRKYNIPYFIYTVDSKRKMRKLLNIGVTGIFTNKPDVLNNVVQERAAKQ